jgi:hypothetical protein
VLGALEPSESERFRLHLAECVVCRDEVQALRAAADALPMAAPQLRVPAALRRRVLRQVRAERRVGVARERRSRFALRLPPPRAMSRAPALAGGLALVATAVVVATRPWHGGSSQARQIEASVRVPAARATLRVVSGRGELVIGGMPAAPQGRIYEVWVRRAGSPPAPTSALFDVTSSGRATVDVPGDLRGAREVLVTDEPRGGSLRPTRMPVIRASLA